MKNSPSAVAGGLFFCVRRDGEFRAPAASALFVSDGDNFAPAGGDGAFRAPARVTFFFCKKKVTKENHSNLRFKDPLARGGQVRIWRCVLAGGVQLSSLSVKRTVPAFTGAEAGAAACPSHGRGVCFYRVAIIKSRPLRREAPQWVGVPCGHGV